MSVTFPERVDALVAQSGQLDADAVRRVLDLLGQLHERVLVRIAQRPDLTISDTRALRIEIQTLTQQFEAQLASTVSGYQQLAWDISDDVVDAELAAAGLRTGTVGISTQTLSIVQGYSAELIKGLSADALEWMNTELQLASLGGRSFSELVKNIGRNLDSPSVFGKVATRAEMIARTEVGRAFSLGYQKRGNEVAASVPGTRKMWVHATGMMVGKTKPGQYRPRPAHVALDGTTIPWEEMFSVNGYAAPGPLDSRLPASETVGCLCRLVMDFTATVDPTLSII